MSIKLCLIGDSNVDRHFAKIKAARNDPCFQNVSVTDVRATLAEVTVIQSEEKDGRLNER